MKVIARTTKPAFIPYIIEIEDEREDAMLQEALRNVLNNQIFTYTPGMQIRDNPVSFAKSLIGRINEAMGRK